MAGELRMTAGESKGAGETASKEECKSDQSLNQAIVEPDGPPDLTEADFAHIPHWGTRQMAWKEYQRTIQEFRQAGSAQEKTRKDFAHFVHPRDTPDHLLAAHRRAIWQIEQWQEAQREAERRQNEEERRWETEHAKARFVERVRSVGQQLDGAEDESDDEDDEVDDGDQDGSDAGPETGSFADAHQDAKVRLDALKSRAALVEQTVPAQPMPMPQVSKTTGLLRGVSFDPDLPGRNARFRPAIPQLEVAPRPERLPPSGDETEALLNAMIGECHFLMREVAFRSMCHARVADDRLHWVSKAMELAKTGSTVAKAVARLRHGPTVKETRQTVVVENKVVAMAARGGGCANP